MVESRKIEAIAAKCQKARGRISLSSKKEESYKSEIGDETDLDQAGDNKNQLQL